MGKKTWNQKLLTAGDYPKIEPIDERMQARLGVGLMVIPAPFEVDELMRGVPKGKLITTDLIRRKLAQKHGADTACPLCTGIFVKIAAFASEERAEAAAGEETPYWRTLKTKGELVDKFPDAYDKQKLFLEREGFTVIQKGKKYFVRDYEKYLIE